MDVFHNYEQHLSNSQSTYPNNPSYLANQFIQDNNFQPAHFINMVSNVTNNGNANESIFSQENFDKPKQ